MTSPHITARPPRNALVEYIKRFYLRQRAQSATSSFGNGTRNARATFPITRSEGTDRPVSIRPTISLDNPEAISTSYIVNPRASRSTRNRFTILRKTRSAYSCASRHRLDFASARAFASARLSRFDLNFFMGKERNPHPHSFKNLWKNDAPLRVLRVFVVHLHAPQSAIPHAPRAGNEKSHRVTATSSDEAH